MFLRRHRPFCWILRSLVVSSLLCFSVFIPAPAGSLPSHSQAPSLPTLTSLVPTTLAITQGASSALTVTISAAQAAPLIIILSSSAPSVVFVPTSITIPAGQMTAVFSVAANAPGTSYITASLNASTITSAMTVTAALPTVVSLLPPTTPLTPGSSTTLTVTLSAAQPTNTTVTITTSPLGIVTSPPTVVVFAGQTTAAVPMSTMNLGTASVRATLNASMAEAAVQVTSLAPAIAALIPSSLDVAEGATGHLTVSLNAAQANDTTVSLTVDHPQILQVPNSILVPAGQLQASVTLTGRAVGSATMTATLGSSTKTAVVQVTAPPPGIVSLVPNPFVLEQGTTGIFTLTINAAQPTDTLVSLTSTVLSVLQLPPSVTVPSGSTSVAFPTTGLIPGSATVTASVQGSTVRSTVQVTGPMMKVTDLTPGTQTLPQGIPGVLHVAVRPAPLVPTQVGLMSSLPTIASVPALVTIPAGALGADFPVLPHREGTATIVASVNGGTATAQVLVSAAELVSLALSPGAPTIARGASQSFAATGTFTDGTTLEVTTSVNWSSSSPLVATVNRSGVALALANGTTTISADTASLHATTTLSVLNPTGILQMTPANITVGSGQTQMVTITATPSAGAGGVIITLTQSGAGNVTVSSPVVIPSGQNTVIVGVTGGGAGAVTLTATAPGRLPANSNLTITSGGPTITGFAPTQGPVGTTVTITGTNFDSQLPGNNLVSFNGKPATITSATATTLVTSVPVSATTGPLMVTALGSAAVSSMPFTVLTKQDFSVALSPPWAIALRGNSTTYQVELTSTGIDPLSAAVQLSISGAPRGVSAGFTPPQITGNQVATLVLKTDHGTPVGNFPVIVSATAVLEGKTVVRQTTAQLVVAGAMGKTMSGRILTENDLPLAGVTLTLGSQSALSDASGNFMFDRPPAGRQVIAVDHASLGAPAARMAHNRRTAAHLHTHPMAVTIAGGAGHEMSSPIYAIAEHPTAHPITPGLRAVISPKHIPGLSIHIPDGTTLMGEDGRPNTEVHVTPTSPRFWPGLPSQGRVGTVFLVSFGKPGGGNLNQGVPVVFPNEFGRSPGERVELWYYARGAMDDPAANQWKQYGNGTVSQDGRTIVPDPGIGVPGFCAVAPIYNVQLTASQNQGSGTGVAEPVDASTGAFLYEKTDLTLPGLIPIQIQRSYQSMAGIGIFGAGGGLKLYQQSLQVASAQALRYVMGNGNSYLFSQDPDGLYRNNGNPDLAGVAITLFTDGHKEIRFKDGLTYFFDSTGALIEQRDRNNNRLLINRNTLNQITQIQGPSGASVTLMYVGVSCGFHCAAFVIGSITDSTGRVVSYGYTADGKLTTVTDPTGGVTTYGYDASARMASITNPRGITVLSNIYDGAGRVIQQTQADGSVFALAYTLAGGTITRTTVTDPNGQTSSLSANIGQFPVQRVDAIGQMTRYDRDFATNQVMTVYDPLNRKTSYTYDANGNVTSILDAQGNPTLTEYEPQFNRVTKIEDALANTTRFTYDATGNLISTTDAAGLGSTMTYNAAGQPLTVTDALGNTTRFAYDAAGSLIATTDPLGNTTTRTYDALSRLVSVTDARGKTTRNQYDALSRVTQITDPINGVTAFSYDGNGNLLTVTDAKGQKTTYTYDILDRLASRKDPLGRSESYQYDGNGNLKTFTDRKGQITTYTYDAQNRRTGASYADGSTTTFAYDAAGRTTSVADSVGGTITWSYDLLDRLATETAALGAISYTYDAIGRRTQMSVNGQSPMTYQYDPASRLTQVAQVAQVVGMGYDAAGRRITLSYPNGVATTYNYDAASRITNIAHAKGASVIEAMTYVYDAAGNRTRATRSNAAATLLPAAVTATYDAANEQVRFNSGTNNEVYDANGNLTSFTDASGTTTYSWDARNRLTALSRPGVTASFAYDGTGRRKTKTINSVTTNYQYDSKEIVAETGASTANYLRSLSIDEPFVRQGASNEFYHADALGSTLALSNAIGALTTTYSYEDYGKTTILGTSTNPFQYTGRENDGTGLYYYRARYYSPMLQRFLSEDPFNPSSAILARQFQTNDQLGPSRRSGIGPHPWRVDTNLYEYVNSRPTMLIDPMGLDPVCPGGCCGGPSVTGRTMGTCMEDWIIGIAKCQSCNLLCGLTCGRVCLFLVIPEFKMACEKACEPKCEGWLGIKQCQEQVFQRRLDCQSNCR